MASCALFRVDWPPAALVTVLFLSGFFTSFLFTGYNAIAFVDMDQDRMSAATSLYATFQQLSLSLGICFAASILELSAPMTARSFSIAFVIIGVVAIGATLVNHAIPRDAGK